MVLHPFQHALGIFQALSLPKTFAKFFEHPGEFAKALAAKPGLENFFKNCWVFCDALKLAGEMVLHPFPHALGIFQALSLPETFFKFLGYLEGFAKALAAKPGLENFF